MGKGVLWNYPNGPRPPFMGSRLAPLIRGAHADLSAVDRFEAAQTERPKDHLSGTAAELGSRSPLPVKLRLGIRRERATPTATKAGWPLAGEDSFGADRNGILCTIWPMNTSL
jgi:hypothetical protein